jgi:FlaA1/EpsC-like NDP-sugar epimerase
MPGNLLAMAIGVPVSALCFRVFGLYRGIWVFASLPDLLRIARAVALAAVIVPVIVLIGFRGGPVIPRSVFILQPLLLLVVMGGLRAAFRTWKEHRLYGGLLAKGKPVLVLGAGRAGADLARELSRSPRWRVAGFLDDDYTKRGRELQGAKVLGPIADHHGDPGNGFQRTTRLRRRAEPAAAGQHGGAG